MFSEDVFTFLLAWGRWRRWKRLFLWGAIPGLLFVAASLLIIYGSLLTRQQLASRYLALVKSDVESRMQEVERTPAKPAEDYATAAGEVTEDAAPSAPVEIPPGETPEKDASAASLAVSPQVLVPLRRLMQLGNSNFRVTYLVAVAMAEQGRIAMAAQMMREIAPLGGGGFPPAHAFMGDFSLASWKGTKAQAAVLLADYEAAENGGVKLKLDKLRALAQLLLGFDRKQDAINMLLRHTDEYPELHGDIVQIEQNEGSNARSSLAAGRATFEEKRNARTATFDDFKEAVRLELLDNKIDRALQLAELSLQFQEQHPTAVRLLSTVLLVKHQAVTEQRKVELARAEALRTEPPAIDLQYLDRACRIDSSNPVISQELAKVISLGQQLTPEMQQTLEESLIDGSASGVAHLILANRKLMGEEPQSALPQLRLALLKMPDSPIVLNNLAFAIMKYDPQNLPEAKRLLERALQIPSASKSEQASMLDTLGDIRLAEDDLLGAVEVFEEAIKYDGTKLNTRRKLAETFSKLGMQELADGQLAKIKEVSEK